MDKKEKCPNIHAGHRQRLRENVLKNGLSNMHDHQVLEFLLTFVMPQKDTNELAHRLIKTFGSFANVMESDINRLKTVNGVGDVIAHFIYNFRSFFYFYQQSKINSVTTLKNSSQTFNYLKMILADKITEEVYLVGLDSQNRVIYSGLVERGSKNHTSVTIRKITNILIHNNIGNVIIAHNHPSGYAHPSSDDDIFTKNLLISLHSNEVHLLDHIIIGENDEFSYFGSGKLDDYRNEYKALLSNHLIAQPKAQYEVSKNE